MTDQRAAKVADLSPDEARKLITSAVANGVLMAGLVLLLLSVAAGFALGLAGTGS